MKGIEDYSYLVKLVRHNINILGLSCVVLPAPNPAATPATPLAQYIVQFEYAIMQGDYKRWAKVALPLILPLEGEPPFGEICTRVVEVAEKARTQLER